jgi:hypothetical protein
MYILNGVNSPAAFTCHTGRGESTVDYVLCNKTMLQVKHTSLEDINITDHDLLSTYIPLSHDSQKSYKDSANEEDDSTGPQAEKRAGHPRKEMPETMEKIE